MTTVLTLPYIYFSQFGLLSKHSWHNNQSWANFGSFIGGTLGPILSGLAFLGVWKTYQLQNKQLQHANNQRRSDDIQRLISATSERIDSILKTPVNLNNITCGHNTNGEMYDVEKTIAFMYSTTKQPNVELGHFVPVIKEEIAIELARINFEAANLAWLLEHQESTFGEKTLTNHYYFRYGKILGSLSRVDIPLDPITLDVFQLSKDKMAD